MAPRMPVSPRGPVAPVAPLGPRLPCGPLTPVAPSRPGTPLAPVIPVTKHSSRPDQLTAVMSINLHVHDRDADIQTRSEHLPVRLILHKTTVQRRHILLKYFVKRSTSKVSDTVYSGFHASGTVQQSAFTIRTAPTLTVLISDFSERRSSRNL